MHRSWQREHVTTSIEWGDIEFDPYGKRWVATFQEIGSTNTPLPVRMR